MSSFEINVSEADARILNAYATIRGTTVIALIQQSGVEGAISAAIQEQIHLEIGKGIKADVRAILIADWNSVWNSVSQYRTKNDKVPESIVAGIESRIPVASTPTPSTP